MKKIKLKDCPFCDYSDIKVILDSTDPLNGHIECMGCGIEVRYVDCINSAISLWNRRSK